MTSEPVELTSDPEFARRVIRLALTSSIALGLVWLLAILTLDLHPGVSASLALGWISMPSILLLSLRRPQGLKIRLGDAICARCGAAADYLRDQAAQRAHCANRFGFL